MRDLRSHSSPIADQVKWLIGVAFIAIVFAGLMFLPR